jgi:hypothetical protein
MVIFGAMDDAGMLQQLEGLAADLEVDLRHDDMDGAGGLCRYGGRACLLVNRALPPAERLRVVVHALARLPLEDVFVRPQVRELLDRCRLPQVRRRA